MSICRLCKREILSRRPLSRVVAGCDSAVSKLAPDALLVQGDTTSALGAALSGFYRRVPVLHIEAGLRTHDRYSPFPEEMNRTIIGQLASFHFAPTTVSRDALIKEGVHEDAIMVTGNTSIDMLRLALASQYGEPATPLRRIVLLTLHRRENLSERVLPALRAIKDSLSAFPDVVLLIPLHRNPTARAVITRMFENNPNVIVREQFVYPEFVSLLCRAAAVITDSGGVQEECVALDRPLIILRDTTERKEALGLNNVHLVGVDAEAVAAVLHRVLTQPSKPASTNIVNKTFGNGHASEVIADQLSRFVLQRASRGGHRR